jgi:hypothetical protein
MSVTGVTVTVGITVYTGGTAVVLFVAGTAVDSPLSHLSTAEGSCVADALVVCPAAELCSDTVFSCASYTSKVL